MFHEAPIQELFYVLSENRILSTHPTHRSLLDASVLTEDSIGDET